MGREGETDTAFAGWVILNTENKHKEKNAYPVKQRFAGYMWV